MYGFLYCFLFGSTWLGHEMLQVLKTVASSYVFVMIIKITQKLEKMNLHVFAWPHFSLVILYVSDRESTNFFYTLPQPLLFQLPAPGSLFKVLFLTRALTLVTFYTKMNGIGCNNINISSDLCSAPFSLFLMVHFTSRFCHTSLNRSYSTHAPLLIYCRQ